MAYLDGYDAEKDTLKCCFEEVFLTFYVLPLSAMENEKTPPFLRKTLTKSYDSKHTLLTLVFDMGVKPVMWGVTPPPPPGSGGGGVKPPKQT